MSKKILPILLAAVLVSACLGGTENNTQNPSQSLTNEPPLNPTLQGNVPPVEETETTTLEAVNPTANKDILSDMAKAVSSGAAYRCKLSYQGVDADTYLQGKKYYIETNEDGSPSYIINDRIWMYLWSQNHPDEGVKFNIDEMRKIAPNSSTSSAEDFEEISQKADSIECQPTPIPEGTFIPPSNVTFTDMGKLFKGIQ